MRYRFISSTRPTTVMMGGMRKSVAVANTWLGQMRRSSREELEMSPALSALSPPAGSTGSLGAGGAAGSSATLPNNVALLTTENRKQSAPSPKPLENSHSPHGAHSAQSAQSVRQKQEEVGANKSLQEQENEFRIALATNFSCEIGLIVLDLVCYYQATFKVFS